MTELQAAEVRLQLTQPQSLLEKSGTLATDTPLSLQVAIGFSQASLDHTAHQALLDLSLFPPKPNTFSEASAQARTYLEWAVKFRREMSYMRAEGKSLAHLGLVYHYLGERQLALECCQQALQIAFAQF